MYSKKDNSPIGKILKVRVNLPVLLTFGCSERLVGYPYSYGDVCYEGLFTFDRVCSYNYSIA